MLEARAHQQLKALLQQEGADAWPHHLSFSRLVGRSLRRGDHSLIRLAAGCSPSWWVSLLVPLALSDASLALVIGRELRQRVLQVELPRLARAGLHLPCSEGEEAPPPGVLWLLDHRELVTAWRQQRLGARQLILPEAERLDDQLRRALAITIRPPHWDQLRRALPRADRSLLELHERLSRRVMTAPRHPEGLVPLNPDDEAPLRQLLGVLGPLPAPWPPWLEAGSDGWTSWAEVDPQLLQWTLHRQPLDPLAPLADLLHGRGAVLIGQLHVPAESLGMNLQLDVRLDDTPLGDALPLFAPRRQPMPNSPIYGEHLLEQCRRLVLGQDRLTLILADDAQLRHQLTSALAADFGSRVVHECTTPDSHGVVCASWDWWLDHQAHLPLPAQMVVALLPIASLEDPLTAARVAALRNQGRDWFRELLLPDALLRLQLGVAGLRKQPGTRLAILDGRLRGRSWGQRVLQALEPWVQLNRLLPT